jgi:catechol 2,3-dioxygenase-like lactoylglutathione lyase family enzyme
MRNAMRAPEILRTNTILYCRRWQATVAFYRDLPGLTIRHTTDWFVEFQVTGHSFVSIADAARATIPSTLGAGITLSWQVADLEGFHRHLNDHGAAPGAITTRWGARCFYFHDPEGHRLEAWAPGTDKEVHR